MDKTNTTVVCSLCSPRNKEVHDQSGSVHTNPSTNRHHLDRDRERHRNHNCILSQQSAPFRDAPIVTYLYIPDCPKSRTPIVMILTKSWSQHRQSCHNHNISHLIMLPNRGDRNQSWTKRTPQWCVHSVVRETKKCMISRALYIPILAQIVITSIEIVKDIATTIVSYRNRVHRFVMHLS